jgi:curved DNA-binding protein CbpA
MPLAFQYRPRFVDIRVRPPKPEEAATASDSSAPEPGERSCDHAECRAPASTRAPKSRDLPGEHYWFCQAHAAEYNRAWNFFAGMTEGEIRAKMAEELSTGGRPTWSVAHGGRNREAAAGRGFFRDPFGIFGAGRAGSDAGRAAVERRMGKLERGALADLDLDATATGPIIRERYVELVKRCHPDANGGDRSSEHKLQRVIKAYKTLRKAKLA